MFERSMQVDTMHLHAGADRCGDAAATALAAAARLAGKRPMTGMFGDFGEAQAFHRALSAALEDHVDRLHGHHRTLGDIADQSRAGAASFTARDAAAAESVLATEAGFDAI